MKARDKRRQFCCVVLSTMLTGLVVALVYLGEGSAGAQARTKSPEASGPFLAGAATSNITPWLGVSLNGGMRDRKATYVHDELHARCLVLDDGRTRLGIVVSDSCMIPREVFDEAKRLVERETGLPATHLLMAATHTHSAPASAGVFQSDADANYRRFLTRRIADGVRLAIHNLEPARIGWAVGAVPEHVFNRRWYMKAGSIPPDPFGRQDDRVKMNPPRGSEDLVEPAGPTDPGLPVVSVVSTDGRPIALLANYSLHYVGGTGGGHVSADYFGMFADRVQQLLGADRLDPPFVGMLSNGTSGDINNINFRNARQRTDPYEQMRRVADDVADEAYRVAQQIDYHDWVSLDVRQTTLELGVRKPTADEVAQAREILQNAEGRDLRSLEEIYARETVLLDQYPDEVEMILQAMRIGDLGIAAIPCEVFVEIGLQIKEQSPLDPTFAIELANGYNGYLPTVQQHQLGGYETWRARSSYLDAEAATRITPTVRALLKDLARRRHEPGESQ